MRNSVLIAILLCPPLGWSQSCNEQNIKLQVLGSGGPELSDGWVEDWLLIELK